MSYSRPIHCLHGPHHDLGPIYCLFTVYSLPISCLFTDFSLHSLCTHCLFTVYPGTTVGSSRILTWTDHNSLVLFTFTSYSSYLRPIRVLFASYSCLLQSYSPPIHVLFTANFIFTGYSLPIHCLVTAYQLSIQHACSLTIQARVWVLKNSHLD
jgi:hypothetical protein